MKEIVVISGKGGTGKTSLCAAFAYIEKDNCVVADCDVDAANLHLVLGADFGKRSDFYSGFLASIDKEKCISCNKCMNVCHFDAVEKNNGKYSINDMDCEGCGYCEKICPADSISMSPRKVGETYLSKKQTRFSNVSCSP